MELSKVTPQEIEAELDRMAALNPGYDRETWRPDAPKLIYAMRAAQAELARVAQMTPQKQDAHYARLRRRMARPATRKEIKRMEALIKLVS